MQDSRGAAEAATAAASPVDPSCQEVGPSDRSAVEDSQELAGVGELQPSGSRDGAAPCSTQADMQPGGILFAGGGTGGWTCVVDTPIGTNRRSSKSYGGSTPPMPEAPLETVVQDTPRPLIEECSGPATEASIADGRVHVTLSSAPTVDDSKGILLRGLAAVHAAAASSCGRFVRHSHCISFLLPCCDNEGYFFGGRTGRFC